MATNNASVTIGGQRAYVGGWHDYGTDAMYAGKTESSYYPYILKFTTPDFIGASEYLAVTLKASKGYGSNVTLRYAICTSDANKGSYNATYSPVTDANQIVTGTWTMESLGTSNKAYSINIATTELEAATTYYLFLWGYNTSSMWVLVAATSNHTLSLYYNEGVVYIRNGTSFDAYQAYVYNGSSWDLCLPHVYNASTATWELCSG